MLPSAVLWIETSVPFGAFCDAADDVPPSTAAASAVAANTSAPIGVLILFMPTPFVVEVRNVLWFWRSQLPLVNTGRHLARTYGGHHLSGSPLHADAAAIGRDAGPRL